MNEDDTVEGREIADLLPFYANGTLLGPEKTRVEAALAVDPALRRELGLVLEERLATIEANENLGAPSRAAHDRFFAMLATQPTRLSRRFDVAGWLAARFEALRPRTLAWSALAAVAIVAIQAGAIGFVAMRSTIPKPGFETASVPTGPTSGALVIVGFAPYAKAIDIAKLLTDMDATIVAGPMPGGLYQIRFGGGAPSKAAVDAIVARLSSESSLVRFAAPSSVGGGPE